MAERQEGYYWVKAPNGKWVVGFWRTADSSWYFCGSELPSSDEEVATDAVAISEKIEP